MRFGDQKYLNLLREMTLAQFKVKDQSSFFGFLWSFLNPLLLLTLLFVLFNSRLGEDIEHYGVFLLIGIVYYTYFSNATTAAMQILLARVTLTRHTVFPKDVLVISTVATNTVEFLISMLICVMLALWSGVGLSSALLALPCVVVLQILLVLWVAFLLSSFYVYVRDLAHVYNLFLRILFFITPIFYSISFVGDGRPQYIVLANPLTHSITLARTLIIEGELFNLRFFSLHLAANMLLVYLTYQIFKKLEPAVSENV
jgi:ABC-type polysaccharide/polyol phosphate export permease